MRLWIDGEQKAELSGIDNDTRVIDQARLGAVSGVDSSTTGTYYFDAFESRRSSYIGLAGLDGVRVAKVKLDNLNRFSIYRTLMVASWEVMNSCDSLLRRPAFQRVLGGYNKPIPTP